MRFPQFLNNVKGLKTARNSNLQERNCMARLIQIGSDKSVDTAVDLLQKGRLIAIPTDTIYGIAADSQNPEAVRALYDLKGRDLSKPIAVCVGSVGDIENWAEINRLPPGLLTDLLPGPVTVLLKRTLVLNPSLNPGIQKIGIRIPQCPFIQKVSLKFGSPIALTSANSSNERSTLLPQEFKHLWSKLDAIFENKIKGTINSSRAGSTIVDLSEPGIFSIVREGSALTSTVQTLLQHNLTSQNEILFREKVCKDKGKSRKRIIDE